MRATIPNRSGALRPGMALRWRVTVNAVNVPLAVRTEAIQPFRDFKVVYANFGQDYEVRMLKLGCSRSEEHTSELQSLMRISYAVFCLKKKKLLNIRDRCTTTLQHSNLIHSL